MAKRNWPYGSAVKNGVPQYFSPSALTNADTTGEAGCLRRWWFQYVKGIKSPETDAQRFGTELHASIEDYLRTGQVENLMPLARRGMSMFPEPGQDLSIEWDIVGGKLAAAPLRAAGIPIAGYIDLVHRRGVWFDGDTVIDEPKGTTTVLDWKTTSNTKYIKSPQEMSRTLQMTTYGKWATTVYPDTEYVRLAHGYFVTKGKADTKLVSLRVHRDQIDKQWGRVEKVAREVIDVAKETDQDKVPGNKRACDAYSGCYYRDICTYAKHNSLSDLGFSGQLSSEPVLSQEEILAEIGYTPQANIIPATIQPVEGKKVTSLLDKMKNKAKGDAPEAKKPNADEIAAQKAKLLREEMELKYPNLKGTLEGFTETGLGSPTLTGEAAKAANILTGSSLVDGKIPGTGELADSEFDDPSVLADVLAEAKEIAASRAGTVNEDAAPQLVPDEAPAGDVVETKTVEKSDAIEAAVAPKKKAGRPPKKTVAAPVEAPAEVPVTEAPAQDAQPTPTIPQPVFFYVDCVPSVPSEPFWPLVNQLLGAIAAQEKVDDVRTAPKDSPLAFGGWKGVLAHQLRLAMQNVPAGHYTLDGASTEIGQVVADAMREIIRQRGGLYVRGVR